MKRAKVLLLILGMVAVAIGLIWVGQGTGYVHWPQTSLMINQMRWAYYGSMLAICGLVAVVLSRR